MMRTIYWILVTACIAQRLGELLLSRRNRKELFERGYVDCERAANLVEMISLHALWLAALVAEPLLVQWNMPAAISLIALAVYLAAQLLRWWALKSLGREWNISVMARAHSPEAASSIVAHGPYRYIRHPNYLAVIIEFFSLPLVGGAVATAVLFSILNGFVLSKRIRREEQQLLRYPQYVRFMMQKPRFIPRLRASSATPVQPC